MSRFHGYRGNINPERLSAELPNIINLLGSIGYGAFLDAKWSPDGKKVGVATSHGLYIHDALDFSKQPEIVHDVRGVNTLDFSVDCAMLASGEADGAVRLWSVSNGALFHIFEGHSEDVMSVKFSPDGKHLASGGSDGQVRLWDIRKGQLVHTFAAKTQFQAENPRVRRAVDRIQALYFSDDGSKLAGFAIDDRSTIFVWDILSNSMLQAIQGKFAIKKFFAFSHLQNYFAVETTNKYASSIQVYDLTTGDLDDQTHVQYHQSSVEQQSEHGTKWRSQDIHSVYVPSAIFPNIKSKSVILRKLTNNSDEVLIQRHPPDFFICPNSQTYLFDNHGDLRLIEGDTGELIQRSSACYPESAIPCAVDVDRNQLILRNQRYWMRCDLETGNCFAATPNYFPEHALRRVDMAWFEGQYLCTEISDTGEVVSYEVTTAKIHKQVTLSLEDKLRRSLLRSHHPFVHPNLDSIALSDNRTGELYLIDLNSGEPIKRVHLEDRELCVVQFMPDKTSLLLESYTNRYGHQHLGQVCILDIETGEEKFRVQGTRAMLNPDNQTLFTMNYATEKTEIWHVDSRQKIDELDYVLPSLPYQYSMGFDASGDVLMMTLENAIMLLEWRSKKTIAQIDFSDDQSINKVVLRPDATMIFANVTDSQITNSPQLMVWGVSKS